MTTPAICHKTVKTRDRPLRAEGGAVVNPGCEGRAGVRPEHQSASDYQGKLEKWQTIKLNTRKNQSILSWTVLTISHFICSKPLDWQNMTTDNWIIVYWIRGRPMR